MASSACSRNRPHVTRGTGPPISSSLRASCSYVSCKHFNAYKRKCSQVKAGGDDEQDVGDMFQRELEKRNISRIEDIKESPGVIAPPSFAAGTLGSHEDQDEDSQLERSRNLNSEGLEGLIPRGSQLLQLGASFFLAFGPFILFVLVSFGAVYSIFGDLFVHTGSPSAGVPQYIDPMELLSEPTVDPMIPM